MRKILDLVASVAATDSPVLIQGEFGVGKATIAHELHRQSRRAAGAFVYVACGALRETDLNNRLFNPSRHGPVEQKPALESLIESSLGGTLFLDDVGQLPMWLQVSLLDFLRSNAGQSAPDGGGSPSGVRVIAATTRDLQSATQENQFYSGLYYYLNVVQIAVPPLRHRQEDLRALGERFLAAASAARGPTADGRSRRITEGAWQTLLSCDLPGNAVQLASLIARAVMLTDGPELCPAVLTESLRTAHPYSDSETISVPLIGGLRGMERAIIGEVLRRCGGNKAAAARTLGMHRRTLYRMLDDLTKDPPSE